MIGSLVLSRLRELFDRGFHRLALGSTHPPLQLASAGGQDDGGYRPDAFGTGLREPFLVDQVDRAKIEAGMRPR